MKCCELPHDARITCEEIAWAVNAPTETEAFRRTMVIAERIKGLPVSGRRRVHQRLRFHEDVLDRAAQVGRTERD